MTPKFCRKCGKPLSEGTVFCPHCGTKCVTISAPEQPASGAAAHISGKTILLFLRKNLLLVILAAIVLIGALSIAVYFSGRCAVDGCQRKAEYGRYCTQHVCLAAGCNNRRISGSNYCRTHTPATPYAQLDLTFSDIEIDHNSSYTVATGTVTNTGSHTYSFVQVRGAFEDRSGTVVDTDWTYAVGSEGLRSGESTQFRLSVDRNFDITDCTVSIIDYK